MSDTNLVEQVATKLKLPEQFTRETLSDIMGEGFLSLKGKQYLQVAYRVVHFRHRNPDGTIYTEHVQIGDTHTMCATVAIGYDVMATAHKTIKFGAGKGPAKDYPIEMAETGAIGRALGLCGYGTLSIVTGKHMVWVSPIWTCSV